MQTIIEGELDLCFLYPVDFVNLNPLILLSYFQSFVILHF